MSICAGLVGLPNVGKSTLFNALTKSSVPAENYPFCTIDPHKAITEVPDHRLDDLQKAYNSQEKIPSTVTFIDIAGLVKGAASGEGLGNQFLSHIMQVDLILHVLRCFTDPDIIASRAEIDPLADFEIINSELMLKDLETVTKRIEKVHHLLKSAKNKPAEFKELNTELTILEQIKSALNAANSQEVTRLVEESHLKTIQLLSAKKFLIIANVSEAELENNEYMKNLHFIALQKQFGADRVIPVSAKIEYELAQLKPEEAQEMMNMLSISERGLAAIIQKTYEYLGLITFFTCGPKEIHAWPIPKGINIRQAAGHIHSDLERGFICADVFNYKDLIEFGNEQKVRLKGKVRTEGQDYSVQNGDIIHVKFNV